MEIFVTMPVGDGWEGAERTPTTVWHLAKGRERTSLKGRWEGWRSDGQRV